jgi:hypothetical protein
VEVECEGALLGLRDGVVDGEVLGLVEGEADVAIVGPVEGEREGLRDGVVDEEVLVTPRGVRGFVCLLSKKGVVFKAWKFFGQSFRALVICAGNNEVSSCLSVQGFCSP